LGTHTNSTTLRIGLIGAGRIAGTHAAAYANISGVKLAGVWDADFSRAQAFGARFGAPACKSRDELFALADVIDICLPTPFHVENIVAAAGAKKPVICEKPLGRNVAQCDEAIAACERAGVPLLVGHVLRFFPEYAALREIITSGQIGEPAVLRLRRVVCSPGAARDWYWNLEASGGCVFDTAIHDLDWLLWTLGRPKTVFGLGQSDASKMRDFALLTLSWPNGVLAHLESSWCHDRFATSFEVTGSEGLVECDMDDATPIRVVPLGGGGGTAGQVVPESPLAKSPYQAELEHFVDVIRGRAEAIITPAEARDAVELAELCLRAVKQREALELPKGKGAAKVAKTKKKLAALPAAHPE